MIRHSDIGAWRKEVIAYDEDGQALSTTLMDYPIPRADDMPPLIVEHLYFPTDHNALGVRGVGEGATGPPPTVIANAISDAFDGRLDIPTPVFTPDRVFTLLRDVIGSP